MKHWALSLSLTLSLGVPSLAADPAPSWKVGDPAPLFTLKGLDGKPLDSSTLKGSPSVLFFAATWCPYSNKMSKSVKTVHDRFASRGVKVVLINIKETADKASAKWKDEKKLSCPVLLDGDGSVTRAYGDVPPATVILLDREGRIAWFPASTENPALIDWDLKEVQEKLEELAPKRPWFRRLFGGRA